MFLNRFARHSVKLVATEEFEDAIVECYPSTLYPAVINIVDNALHWLNDVEGSRRIELHGDAECIYISNNGPAIDARDSQRMFERGFSRKTGGRGLGLFISAKALKAEDIDLSLADAARPGYSVTFAIMIRNVGAQR